MAEIWLGKARVGSADYDRAPDPGDIVELEVNGKYGDYSVERRAVYYDRNGGKTLRLYVAPLG